jgi:hypothetical protein
MSELTPCNYCTLQRMKRDAKKTGDIITVRAGKGTWSGWIEVLRNGKPADCWFQKLGDHCEC